MNPPKEQTLAALLRQALNTVTLTRSASEGLSPSAYRQMVLRYRSSYDPALRLNIALYTIQIGDAGTKESIFELLRNELKEFIREDRTYSASFAIVGGSGNGSTIEDILNKIVTEAIVRGPVEAARVFYDGIGSEYLTFQRYFLLTGIRIEREVQVFDGVSLVPLPNSTGRLPVFLPSLYHGDPVDFLSKTLLRIDMSVSPVLHKPAQDYTFESGPEKHFKIAVQSSDVTEFYPDKFFQAMTMVEEHTVQWAIGWTYFSDENIFDLSRGIGSGYSYASVETRNTPSTIFSESQVRDCVDLYYKMVSLPQDVQDQLRIPLDRWVKSKTNQDHVDKMIDLGIALESFYLAGIGERDQLSFRFRLRASLYLGESMDKRKQLIREFREIYDCRSKAVHEGKLPELVRIEGQNIPIGEFITRAQDLCKQSLLNAIENGQIPDWASIELGEEDG